MSTNAKLPLQMPDSGDRNLYFSIKIKDELLAERCVYQRPDNLLVLSDIEGNFEAFRKILYTARVIDKKNRWTFGDGHLIITGNCFNKEEQVIECLWLIYSLEEKAKKNGGYVHFILGNHEILNLNGDWRHLHPRYASNVRKTSSAYLTLYDGNNEIWRWLQTKNIIEKIGELLFLHGGISPELLQLNYSLEMINRKARQHYTQSEQLPNDPLLNILFDENSSPFLYTGYHSGDENPILIEDTLARYGVQKIITGNTAMEKISSFYDSKVFNVNTCHAAGNSQALLVIKNNFYRLYTDGKRERI